ncbi:MAG TPA: prepilin-type N-terminal cleavage/methylation domain-containing protein [Candidatus Paceibacterota bacterium]|nr:prepilin-type N-terminal cleavage/methylation domain-containing protein [Candidatus Paceibacterota bacterium]
MKFRHIAGFTLIELLVVISIIALLSGVVISTLTTARNRGGDSAVKAGMKQMITQAQNYLDSNSNLGTSITTCTSGVFNDTKFAAIRANVLANAAAGATMTCATNFDGTKWAVGVSALKGGGTFCVDNSQGWFKTGTVDTTNAICQ